MPSSAPSNNADKSNDKSNGPVRSFGRRRGKKLRPGRERLVDELLPKITFDTELGLAEQFGPDTKDIWMEIGFGGGEHLAAQALAHPDIGFIGAEPFINGVAKLVSTINDEGIKNVPPTSGSVTNGTSAPIGKNSILSTVTSTACVDDTYAQIARDNMCLFILYRPRFRKSLILFRASVYLQHQTYKP